MVNSTTLLIIRPGIMHQQLQIHLSAVTSPTLPERALARTAPRVLIMRLRMKLSKISVRHANTGFGGFTIDPTYLKIVSDAISGSSIVCS